MKRSKNYRAAAELVTPGKVYAPLEAVRVAKQTAKAKYDETVEVAMRLGVDPRKADQAVRGTVNLPHGTGKTAKVLVFANGDKAEAAREAGADYVGSDDMLEKVQGGWLDFDAVVATPDMMGKVGRLGKVLGPRGLMPNPKTGTVTMDVAKAVTDIKGGKIEFRVDKHANLHFIIGKASFDETKLVENYAAALEEILRLKPSQLEGSLHREGHRLHDDGPGHPARLLQDPQPPRRGRAGLTPASHPREPVTPLGWRALAVAGPRSVTRRRCGDASRRSRPPTPLDPGSPSRRRVASSPHPPHSRIGGALDAIGGLRGYGRGMSRHSARTTTRSRWVLGALVVGLPLSLLPATAGAQPTPLRRGVRGRPRLARQADPAAQGGRHDRLRRRRERRSTAMPRRSASTCWPAVATPPTPPSRQRLPSVSPSPTAPASVVAASSSTTTPRPRGSARSTAARRRRRPTPPRPSPTPTARR